MAANGRARRKREIKLAKGERVIASETEREAGGERASEKAKKRKRQRQERGKYEARKKGTTESE